VGAQRRTSSPFSASPFGSTTPAMTAGVTKRLWEIVDIVDVLEAWETQEAK
jgi:hypothetical protein